MHQAAALPFRRAAGGEGDLEFLLVNSRSDHWLIPKGDIDDGMAPHLAAERKRSRKAGFMGGLASAAWVGSVRARSRTALPSRWKLRFSRSK